MNLQSGLMLADEAAAGNAIPLRKQTVRVLMAAGGTGGHIFPALAIADEMRARSRTFGPEGRTFETVFLGTGRGLESRVIPQAGYPLQKIQGAGLKGIGGWKKLANLATLAVSALQAAEVLRGFRPHVVVGIGGYISGPIMLEAALVGTPTLLFEPNAVPGFTNRVLAPVVRLAAVGFENAQPVYGTKARLTGHPVRPEFFSIAPKLHTGPFTVLILGGSQGARAINQCLVESLPAFRGELGESLGFLHQTGEADYNTVQTAYKTQSIRAEASPFFDKIAEAFSRADLIVGRAGATTVAELAAAGKASILIPFPSATDQHQLQNARALERAGGASLIEQKDLTPQRLVKEVTGLLRDVPRLGRMEQSSKRLARPDAAARIADLIENLAAGGE